MVDAPSSHTFANDVTAGHTHSGKKYVTFPEMDIRNFEFDEKKENTQLHSSCGAGQDSSLLSFHHHEKHTKSLEKTGIFNRKPMLHPLNPIEILNSENSPNFPEDQLSINNKPIENIQQPNITGEIWIDTLSLQDWFQGYINETLRSYASTSGFENAFMTGS